MASAVKLVGRTTDFKGKTLWEIVGSLKNFGVGRVVKRNMFQRYPEPCFMRILKVEAAPNATGLDETRRVRVTVEKTFRGRQYPKPIEIFSASYKADYELVPKHEEEAFCKITTAPRVERVLPREIELPPLLKAFVEKEKGVKNPKIPLTIRHNREKFYHLAREGEQPTIEVSMGLLKPMNDMLLEGHK